VETQANTAYTLYFLGIEESGGLSTEYIGCDDLKKRGEILFFLNDSKSVLGAEPYAIRRAYVRLASW
jgi:hypothetical protein